MRTWLVLGALLLAPVICRADNLGMRPVETNHWSYSAIQRLSRWGANLGFSADANLLKPLTRYEMSVATARSVDKFGYNPVSKNDVDGLAVRDVLVALVFEYRDELVRLGVHDIRTTGAILLEDYEADKEAHKHLTPSQWYVRFQEHPWTKVVHPPGYRGKMTPAQGVTPPPRLTITPSKIPKFTEQDRIAREKDLEKARIAHEEYLKK